MESIKERDPNAFGPKVANSNAKRDVEQEGSESCKKVH